MFSFPAWWDAQPGAFLRLLWHSFPPPTPPWGQQLRSPAPHCRQGGVSIPVFPTELARACRGGGSGEGAVSRPTTQGWGKAPLVALWGWGRCMEQGVLGSI